MHEPGKIFEGVVSVKDFDYGTRLVIDAKDLQDNWNGRGIYVNSSSEEKTHEGVTVQANQVLFPDDTTLNLNNPDFDKDAVEFFGSNQNDFFDSTGYNYSYFSGSAGVDQYIGSLRSDGTANGEINFEHYHDKYGDENTGVQLDFSTGTLTFQTNDGTTTASNVRYINGTTGNDTIIGSDLDVGIGAMADRFYLNGGSDTITGGLGSDGFDGIYPYQQAVTITDFEDFEYVSFDDRTGGSNPQVYGFNSQNIENQFSINYDETLIIHLFQYLQIMFS